jgi:hypothetical protein
MLHPKKSVAVPTIIFPAFAGSMRTEITWRYMNKYEAFIWKMIELPWQDLNILVPVVPQENQAGQESER